MDEGRGSSGVDMLLGLTSYLEGVIMWLGGGGCAGYGFEGREGSS